MTDIPTWKQKLEQQYINLAFDPAALSDLSKKEASYLKKKKDEVTIRSSAAEYLTYVASVGGQQDSIEMRYEDENIWLTQKMMAALYDVSVPAINQHLKRIFDDSELVENSVIKKYLITAADGKNYQTNHYNLQAIIAVGFKVNNERAVQFRKWASQIVKDYTIQGWTMDVDRLKKGTMLQTFMQQLSTMIKMQKPQDSFSKLCRTKCIMPRTDILLRN